MAAQKSDLVRILKQIAQIAEVELRCVDNDCFDIEAFGVFVCWRAEVLNLVGFAEETAEISAFKGLK